MTDPTTYEGLVEVQAELDAGVSGVLVTSRGLPVCPACHAEVEYRACRGRTPPTPKSLASILEVIIAAHRRFSCQPGGD